MDRGRTWVYHCSADTTCGLSQQLGRSAKNQEQRETDVVLTVDRGASMLVFIFVSPSAQFQDLEQSFKKVSQSVRFPG